MAELDREAPRCIHASVLEPTSMRELCGDEAEFSDKEEACKGYSKVLHIGSASSDWQSHCGDYHRKKRDAVMAYMKRILPNLDGISDWYSQQ